MTEPVGEIVARLVDGKLVVERTDKRVRVTGELVYMKCSEDWGKIQVGEYTYRCVEKDAQSNTAVYEREG